MILLFLHLLVVVIVLVGKEWKIPVHVLLSHLLWRLSTLRRELFTAVTAIRARDDMVERNKESKWKNYYAERKQRV